MTDRASLENFKNNSKKGNTINICPSYMSLIEMVNENGDEYPSLSNLVTYNYGNRIHEIETIEKYNKNYKLPLSGA